MSPEIWLADDLREANQHMVSATIRAQELTEEVEAALTRSEESERELRAMAEFREMFIGIVGHDLRNPLGTIVFSTERLLHSGHLDAEEGKAVTRIIASTDRMTRMILQLLDLTRARLGGGFPLEPRPTDLRDVCRTVVEEFGAPIHLEIEGDVTGSWDPDRLAEALSNIAGNAIDHARSGTAVVVRARPEGAASSSRSSTMESPFRPMSSRSSSSLSGKEGARHRGPEISASVSTSPTRSCCEWRHARRALQRRHDDLRDASARQRDTVNLLTD